jgi:hypothetical protein
MPRRKSLFIVAGIAFFILLLTTVSILIWLSNAIFKQPVTITLLRFEQTRFGPLARVAITNISSAAIKYHEMRRNARVRIETKAGWITNAIQLEVFLRSPTILLPGSNDVDRIHLPHDAVRLQLLYSSESQRPRFTSL